MKFQKSLIWGSETRSLSMIQLKPELQKARFWKIGISFPQWLQWEIMGCFFWGKNKGKTSTNPQSAFWWYGYRLPFPVLGGLGHYPHYWAYPGMRIPASAATNHQPGIWSLFKWSTDHVLEGDNMVYWPYDGYNDTVFLGPSVIILNGMCVCIYIANMISFGVCLKIWCAPKWSPNIGEYNVKPLGCGFTLFSEKPNDGGLQQPRNRQTR